MRIRKDTFRTGTLSLAFFLVFGGFYAALAVFVNLTGTTDASKALTMPLRVIIVGLFAISFLNQGRKSLIFNSGVIFFTLFSSAYLLRIFIELRNLAVTYHMPPIDFLLYFLSFVLLPFLFVSQLRITQYQYKVIFQSILFGCVIFALLGAIFYRDHIGHVGRLYGSDGDNILSPLILSYVSALGIGLTFSYLMTTGKDLKSQAIGYFLIAILLVPFYLGASRGSLIALALPLVLYFSFRKGINKKARGVLLVFLIVILMVIAQDYMKSSLFDRIALVSQDIGLESTSTIRLPVWRYGIEQFLANPVFGNSLESDYLEFYPHNIVLEVLITTGIIGFIPFAVFLFIVIYKCILIVTIAPKYYWLVVIFTQAFAFNNFSGAIYSASWFSVGAALLLTLPLATTSGDGFDRPPHPHHLRNT